MLSLPEMRKEIINLLPKDAFSPKFQYILIPIFLFIAILSFSYLTLKSHHGYLSLLYSIVLGLLYISYAFYTHHLLHGVVTRSKLLQKIVGQLGYLIILFPVDLWRMWHNVAHHLYANSDTNEDPDANLLLSDKDMASSTWINRIYLSFIPGSKKLVSYFYLFYSLSMGALFAKRLVIKSSKIRESYSKKYIYFQLQSLAMMCFWIILGYWMGIKNAFFVIIIPMLIANFGTMSHIATNHLLMPLTNTNHPLLNSMSVKVYKIFDIMHFNFSHHVEHHIFPTLHWKYYPLIRQYLKKNFSTYYICPNYLEALWHLYTTPRQYKDNNTLYNVVTSEAVTIESIHNKILKNS